MSAVENPFRATLGSSPRFLAGRDVEISEFGLALDEGTGAHERISLIAGLRGVGKTVLLNAFEDEAKQRSWWVVSETATAGFVQRLKDSVLRLIEEHFAEPRYRLTGISLPGVGGLQVSEKSAYQPQWTLREAVSRLLDLQAERDRELGQKPVGLLITVDELHHYRRDEVLEFGAVVQHLVREDREIAVAMAGIPQSVKPLLASENGQNPVTFLRRANRVDLGLISQPDVERALVKPVESVGASWSSEALAAAVEACEGYPFMVQLVGHQSFRKRKSTVIGLDAVREGAEQARRKLGQLVHEPSLADLSDVDRTFLAAMAVDDGPSAMSDIASRLRVSSQYASAYRRRLIDAEMITSTGYGKVDFELPYMRAYLRKHAVVEALGGS